MSRFCTLLILLLATLPATAADWPQWLGRGRDGSSSETVAPWKEPPRLLWSKPVGEGNSSPVVAGGRAFLHTKVKDKFAEKVTAYDAATGKVLWETVYERGNFQSPYGNGPRATPSVVDGKVYTHGITGMLTCLDADTGTKVWQVDTWKDFKPPRLMFGASCSPLVGRKVGVLMVGGKGTGVIAFDTSKGEIVWKALDDGPSYSSPIAFGKSPERQIVFLTRDGLVSLKSADGTVWWRFPFRDLLLESSITPMSMGDLLVASSITQGSIGLRLENKENHPAAALLWKNPALTSYFSTPVAVGKEHFYMVTGTNPLSALNPLAKKKSEATLNCVEAATGKVLWRRLGVGQYHASLLRTGDNKLLMLEEAGDLVLLSPDPKEYRELARAKVCGHSWAHPALADGRLFLRDDKKLYCLQMTK